jgi:hypothetical protein
MGFGFKPNRPEAPASQALAAIKIEFRMVLPSSRGGGPWRSSAVVDRDALSGLPRRLRLLAMTEEAHGKIGVRSQWVRTARLLVIARGATVHVLHNT